MSPGALGPPGRQDAAVRQLLARAAPDVTAPVDLDGDLERGRSALGRRRSLLATLAVGAGTALVAAAAVLVPQGLAGLSGTAGVPATGPLTHPADPWPPADATRGDEVSRPTAPVALGPGPAQHEEDVVATLVPTGWEVVQAGPDSLVLGRDGEVVTVSALPDTTGPPVMGGVGDFERVAGARVSYYLVDAADGRAGRPTMVLELTFGSWAQVSASPALGWGMTELTAFATGLRAPFACTEPCEVPLTP